MVNITKMLIDIERNLALEKGRAEGRAEGLAEGRAEGRAEGLAEVRAEREAKGIAKECQKWILGLLKRGMTKEEIMEIGKISRNELEVIISG